MLLLHPLPPLLPLLDRKLKGDVAIWGCQFCWNRFCPVSTVLPRCQAMLSSALLMVLGRIGAGKWKNDDEMWATLCLKMHSLLTFTMQTDKLGRIASVSLVVCAVWSRKMRNLDSNPWKNIGENNQKVSWDIVRVGESLFVGEEGM